MAGLCSTVPPDAGLIRRAALEIKAVLDQNGVSGMPLGTDEVEPPMLFELQRLGIEVHDGQKTLLDACEIKSRARTARRGRRSGRNRAKSISSHLQS
jgi:hypothetical protein